MKKLTTLVVAVAVIAGLARLCLYTVGEREYALVFGLGELKHIQAEPGLYVKLPAPLQNVIYLDKRILSLDTPQADLVQTSEKKEPSHRQLREVAHWRSAPLLGVLSGQ